MDFTFKYQLSFISVFFLSIWLWVNIFQSNINGHQNNKNDKFFVSSRHWIYFVFFNCRLCTHIFWQELIKWERDLWHDTNTAIQTKLLFYFGSCTRNWFYTHHPPSLKWVEKVVKNPNTVLLNVSFQHLDKIKFGIWGAHQTWIKSL